MNTDHLSVASNAPNDAIVVIGAGLAGWHVIDAIRAKDTDIAITLVTADSGDRYHKPMLTVAISQNKGVADLVRATGAQAAAAANIELLAHTKVTNIDATTQQLQLAPARHSDPEHTNEDTMGYGKLVLAVGAHPIFPKSLPEDMVWHVNHIERFGQLQEKLATGHQQVAIVGAGMVGTEIAEDLLKAGHQVTLIDLNDAPLSQMLPAKATARIAEAVKSQGIRFLGGCQVSDVVRDDKGKLQVSYEALTTTEGVTEPPTPLVVDHVIVSTGLVVDDTLPTAAGIECHRRTGIVVDALTLRTSTANIYAIGDCMSIDGVPCRYVSPLRAQAAIIADEVLGRAHDGYEHQRPMVRLKNKAISVMMTGVPQALGNWQIKTQTDDTLAMELLNDNNEISATLAITSPAAASASS